MADHREDRIVASRRPMVMGIVFAVALLAWPGPARSATVTLVLGSSGDATIAADTPSSTFGTAATVKVDGAPVKDFLLRFDIPGTVGSITRATLRLHNVNGSGVGGFVHTTSEPFDEGSVTWLSAPPAVGGPIGSFGRVVAGTWYTLDVTSAVTGSGVVAFRVTSTSSNGADYVSKEGTAGLGPELVIEHGTTPPPPPPDPATFRFAAAGDIGANSKASASLAALDARAPAFFLALGDLRYGQTATDQAWCDYVIARLPSLGPTFPFQLVAGDQEEQGQTSGDILQLAQCLPDRMGSTLGTTNLYAAEYTFDYPPSNPLVRVIMISPDLRIDDVVYTYPAGSARSAWVASMIDQARTLGIPWVVVGMHRNCINATGKSCAIGTDLFTMLVEKKVDLILQGHAHNYERSKQLALDPATCPIIVRTQYDPDCVVDDGSDGTYTKGAGSLVVIAGSFGRGPSALNLSSPDAAYFAVTDATSHGFVSYEVAADRLDASFVNSIGPFTDAFNIVAGSAPPPPPPTTERSFPAVADATIQESKPDTRFGSASTLEVDLSARKDILVTFDISAIGTLPVTSARLRLHNIDPSGAGGEIYSVAAPGWTESLVTWNSAPTAVGSMVASFGAVSTGWREVDVTSAIGGAGLVGFRIRSPSSNGAVYSSKEAGSALAPVLLVTTT